MEFWVFMTICDLFVPTMMIVGGLILQKRASVDIDMMGNRVFFPDVTKEAWVYSHRFCARVWIVVGSIMFVVTGILQILLMDSEHSRIGNFGILFVILQCLSLMITLVHVEHVVKRYFEGFIHK